MSVVYSPLSINTSNKNEKDPDASMDTSGKGIIAINTNLEHHFISIIGTPPPPSDQRTTPATSVLPAVNPQEIVDVLDAEDEDPFTLETFESMIKLHMDKGLDFIIARVTTADPEDNSRFYYSYYAAHHINKVLFRTQPEEGLLHRMRAKNPLNNMTIIGDVHYYVIKADKRPEQLNQSLSHPPKSPFANLLGLIYKNPDEAASTKRVKEMRERLTKNNQEDTSSFLGTLLGFSNSKPTPLTFMIRQEAFESDIELEERKSIPLKRSSFDDAFSDNNTAYRAASNPKLMLLSKIKTQIHRNVRSHAFANERTNSMTIEEWMRLKIDPSPEAIVMSATTRIRVEDSPRKRKPVSPPSIPSGPKTSPRVAYTFKAHYFASDDDFLMFGNVRAYFKTHALEDQDYVLFTIQNTQDIEAGEAHPTLANLSLFLSGDESRATRRFRTLLKWFVLIYGIISFVLLKYVGNLQKLIIVPNSLIYITAFFLFFFLCLVLIVAL